MSDKSPEGSKNGKGFPPRRGKKPDSGRIKQLFVELEEDTLDPFAGGMESLAAEPMVEAIFTPHSENSTTQAARLPLELQSIAAVTEIEEIQVDQAAVDGSPQEATIPEPVSAPVPAIKEVVVPQMTPVAAEPLLADIQTPEAMTAGEPSPIFELPAVENQPTWVEGLVKPDKADEPSPVLELPAEDKLPSWVEEFIEPIEAGEPSPAMAPPVMAPPAVEPSAVEKQPTWVEEPVEPIAAIEPELLPPGYTSKWLGVQAVMPSGKAGQTAQEDQIFPSNESITPQAGESLRYGRPVTKPALENQPAMLTYARKFGERRNADFLPENATTDQTQPKLREAKVAQSLILEVLDEDPNRTWSEDELLLVEQVTDQLSLALENARLFEESRARAEQLAILNEMSRTLSSQLDIDAVLDTVYRYCSRLIDATNFYIALHLRETNEVAFPLAYEENQPIQLRTRPLSNGLTEFIFRTQRPLLIKEDVTGQIRKVLGAEIIGRESLCYLGVPLLYNNQVTGVIAVQSYAQSHLYDEGHRDLLAAIASQAAVAIENARLYTEEHRRRQIADALSDIARTVSSTLDVRQISVKTLDQLAQLVDYDAATMQLIHNGLRETVGMRQMTDAAKRKLPASYHSAAEGLLADDPFVQSIVETRKPLTLTDTQADPRWLEKPGSEHVRAWLAAPLLVGDQVVGLLALDHTQPGVYSQASVDMVSTVAAQVAVGIQNAHLFEQTQNALTALAVSERYQKSVAQAVAALTERGMAALGEVLSVLGEAARTSRVYYIETQVDPRGAYWRLIAEWRSQGVASQLSNPALRRLPMNKLTAWIEQLQSKGYATVRSESALPEDRAFLDSLGSRSLLEIAVPGRQEIPGCIGFDQTDADRNWSAEEIAALQTAASALANTIAREDLFTQVQINLAETEALYQASARLNSAANYQEILEVLRHHTILGQINASEVTLNFFDRPWTPGDKPEWVTPAAHWSAKAENEASKDPFQLATWPNAEALLHPERPTVVMDVATDPRLEEGRRSRYINQLGAKSLIHAPLNVSGRWIGYIAAAYNFSLGFPEQDLRRLASLAGQAAVAIESLRLLEETRQRNEELDSINQITTAASRTLELSEVLDEILMRVLASIEFESGLISIADPVSHKLSLAVHKNLPEKMVARLETKGMDGTPCDLVYQNGRTIHMPDLAHIPEEFMQWQPAFAGPVSLGFSSYVGVPLESKGVKLGTVCAFSRTPKNTSAMRIALLQAVGQQVGILVDNARLFQNTQIALGETETLYQASAELNAVQSYDDILQTLRKYSILGSVDHKLSLDLFDHPWIGREMPEKAIQAACWLSQAEGTEPEGNNHSNGRTTRDKPEEYSLGEFPAAKTLLRPDAVVSVEDIRNDPRLDERTQTYYTDQQSLIFAPLVVGGLWIGFVHAVYHQPAHWQEADLRRLDVLAGQAAVAAQNLRQFQQIQKRAQYEYKTREIGSQISSTIDRDTILGTTARALCQALNASHVHISLNRGAIGYLYERSEDRFLPSDDPQAQAILSLVSNNPADTSPPQSRSESQAVDGETSRPAYIAVPISLRSENIGDIEVFNITGETEWSEDDIALIQTISSQVALSLDNARLFQETQVALTETETLYQASAELNSVRSYQEIVQTLRKYTLLGQADILLNLALFNRPWFGNDIPEWVTQIAHWTTLPEERLPERYNLNNYPPARLLLPGEPTIFEDLIEDERLDDEFRRLFIDQYHARGALFVPMAVGGFWLGFLSGLYSLPTHFDEQEMRRLAALASQAAVAVQNLRLLDESQRRARQLQTAAEIARDTSSTLALGALLERYVNLLRERFDYYHASIFLLDENGEQAWVRESTGEAGREMKTRGHKLAVGSRSVIGQVTSTGKPLVLNDVELEEAKAIHRPNPLLPLTRAELGIPLKISERVIGALDVQSNRANAFSEDDISVLQILADQLAVAVDNARSYELAQKAMEEIREADRLKSQFLANMSHELRTPLNSIIGFSRVILKGIDGPTSDLQQQDLTAIYNSGQHLLGLINDVLDLSKIEAGKMELAFEENINLGDIIRGVMSTTVGLVKDKPIELRQNIDPNLPSLRIDPMKTRQVLLNLLSNAAKFTESGSITVEAAQVTNQNGKPEVVVRVIDTGPGIAPEDQIKLFQPFSQVDGSLTRKTGGSGLGLSICQHLVSLHNGRIGLTSQIGKGTTFYFTLPVTYYKYTVEHNEPSLPELPDVALAKTGPLVENVAEEAHAEPTAPIGSAALHIEEPVEIKAAPAAAIPGPAITGPAIPGPAISGRAVAGPAISGPAVAGPAISGPGWVMIDPDSLETEAEMPPVEPVFPAGPPAIILAIESDPQVVGLYRRYLDDQNYTIIALTELEQALTVVRGVQPFAITLDVSMQGSPRRHTGKLGEKLDGWKVLQSLKADPYTRQIPIIVCTIVDEQEKAMELGANNYLMKPILEEDLRMALRRLKGY